MSYWDYYDENFDWDDRSDFLRPNLDYTRKAFARMKLSDSETEDYVSSGYIVLENDIVVDRFYGGNLLSGETRTRIPVSSFLQQRSLASKQLPVYNASSMTDLLHKVDDIRKRSRRELVYRGQTDSYSLRRKHPNPFLIYDGLGEISLLPSVWRAMQQKNPNSFLNFQSLSLWEWSKVVYSGFDLAEIERRQDAINASGGWVHSTSEMEDCGDPLLEEFGRTRRDIAGMTSYFADALNTLLQHYGLYSPVLDLTTNLDVALFFATHRFVRTSDHCTYQFIGTNDQHSILYIFGRNANEMHEHEHERALDLVKPLRPERQSCVICRSGPYALNLAADFLVGVVRLNFDQIHPGRFTTPDLFPTRIDDRFLRALKTELVYSDKVTEIV